VRVGDIAHIDDAEALAWQRRHRALDDRLKAVSDDRSTGTNDGPAMNVGFITTSWVSPPSVSMKSQAARSAIALERG
jgi:hypothetical protein